MKTLHLTIKKSAYWLGLIGVILTPLFSQAQSSQGRLSYLQHVDTRDLLTYGTELSGTSNLLMKVMEAYPEKFVGPIDSYNMSIDGSQPSHVRFYRSGAQGPTGNAKVQGGKEVFSIETDRSHTQRNSILSAEFEEIIEEEYDKVFRIKVLLFVQDDYNPDYQQSNGYYFRRLWIRVNWHLPKEQELERVQVLNFVQDIALASTKFNVVGDLLERKVILEEPHWQIYKVFPIAVGAFDIRTAQGMDGVVRSMTDEFPNSKLKKTSVIDGGPHGWNTRSRVYPSYYKARPFVALFQGGEHYRQIGMHYQITSELIRGFVSHGCIRVRDKDLYQLDAILNEGIHDELDVHFVANLQGYDHLNHPMPKVENWYNVVNYSRRATPDVVKCTNSTYRIRYYGSYHTVADGDCLTMVVRANRPAGDVVSYMKGHSGFVPQSQLMDQEHIPVLADRNELDERADQVWASDGGDEHKRGVFKKFFDGFRRGSGSHNRDQRDNLRVQKPAPLTKRQQQIAKADEQIRIIIQRIDRSCRDRNFLGLKLGRGQDCDRLERSLEEWTRYRTQLGN